MLISRDCIYTVSLRMPARMTLTVGSVTMEEMCSAVIAVHESSMCSAQVRNVTRSEGRERYEYWYVCRLAQGARR